MVISMERWKGKVAIVTGATARIGAAIVKKLLEEGVTVVGLARRKEKLEELNQKLQGKSGTLHVVVADVTKEEDILNAFKWVNDNLGPVHILLNTAGIVRITNLTEGDTKLWKDVFDTNIMGLCIATREAVKQMHANKVDGQIIHINSVSGHNVPNPSYANVYSASKNAVRAFTKTLRQELNSIGSKIKIKSISVGTTDVFDAGAKVCGNSETIKHTQGCKETAECLKAEDIADVVAYVLATPPHVKVHKLVIKSVGEKF